jgi:glycerol-3-phosphate dehydrogenase
VVGTTDTPIADPSLEPTAQETEISFILETAALYLHKAPTRADVLSVFAGIRPLVRTGDSRITAALSRDHTIDIDASGLLTTAGGKWTTYRHMAEDTVDQAVEFGRLPERKCVTRELRIHGFQQQGATGGLGLYGADADAIRQLEATDPSLGARLDAELPCTGSQVLWAARMEFARTVEDVLARRCRALFLNAAAAVRMAPTVAALLAKELGRDDTWQRAQIAAFEALARGYMLADS